MANLATPARVEAKLTLDELVRDHPWPRAYADARRLEWLWVIDVDLPSERLWSLVSDVSRLNRALRNPEMKFTEKDGLRFGEARYSGVFHAWHELPWEWVAGRWFTFSRVYSRGAMRTLYAIHRFESLGPGRTRLYVYFGIVPRTWFLAPALMASFALLGRRYRRCIPQLARDPLSLALPEVLVAAGGLSSDAERRVAAIEVTLRDQVEPAALQRLIELVRSGDDLDVCRVQIRQLARSWGLDEDVVLRGCLHATRAGLLELVWDVVCPHCRGVRVSQTQLDAVATEGSCDVCDVTFGTADAVEVSFRVHPSLRSVTPRLYCSAEPATKTHIRVQRALEPGVDSTVAIDLPAGRYRLRTRGGQAPAGFLDVRPDAAEAPIRWRAAAAFGEHATAPSAALALVNDVAAPETFIVEAASPTDLALRPGRLFSLQEFRDLFSEEYLGADVQLSVGEQTILFTDMVGSTAMYARQGDPAAFVTVKKHFQTVFAIIAGHRGAVVKTIGDAAMGAFTDPVDAVRAAEAIQHAFPDGAAVRLRVSINTGACIAVRLNANLDYFGNAVNLAAKLQGAVDAGQIVVSEATYRAPGVGEHLATRAVEAIDAAVKGLTRTVPAWRWSA